MSGRTRTRLAGGDAAARSNDLWTSADWPRRQLPHGRHGLPRVVVETQQRARILRATVDTVAEHGYERSCIDLVITAAGVSRRTFYHLYQDKEDCFLAAHANAQRAIVDAAHRALQDVDPDRPAERLEAVVSALLDAAVADPAAVHVCLGDVVALGVRGLELREDTMRPLTDVLAEDPAAPTGLAAEIVVGGLCEVVRLAVRDGWAPELPTRLPDLVDWVARGRRPSPWICCPA